MRRFWSIVFLVIMMMLGSLLPNPLGRGKGMSEQEPENLQRTSKDSPMPASPDETRNAAGARELSKSMDSAEYKDASGYGFPDGDKPSRAGDAEDKRESAAAQPDKPLAGKVVCIDPGHQSVMKWKKVPIAPGASRTVWDYSIGTRGIGTGTYEYTIALQVSQKLRTALEKLGASVILTRENDDEPVGCTQRAEIANEAHADAFIRIHCDGSEIPEAKGISVLYPGGRYIDDSIMLEKSLALSRTLLEETVKATQAQNRGLFERNDQVAFNYCKVPCTLIEMGFLTNPEEDRLLNSKSYQDKLVQGMVSGIVKYLGEDE